MILSLPPIRFAVCPQKIPALPKVSWNTTFVSWSSHRKARVVWRWSSMWNRSRILLQAILYFIGPSTTAVDWSLPNMDQNLPTHNIKKLRKSIPSGSAVIRIPCTRIPLLDFEIFLEIYAELMMLIVPEKGSPTNRIRRAKVFAVCVLILLLILLIWGMALFSDLQSQIWGIVLITIFILLSAIQIIAGIILYRRRENLSPKSS